MGSLLFSVLKLFLEEVKCLGHCIVLTEQYSSGISAFSITTLVERVLLNYSCTMEISHSRDCVISHRTFKTDMEVFLVQRTDLILMNSSCVFLYKLLINNNILTLGILYIKKPANIISLDIIISLFQPNYYLLNYFALFIMLLMPFLFSPYPFLPAPTLFQCLPSFIFTY